MKKEVYKMYGIFVILIVFFANLIPIIGPSLISGGIGFNEKRFKKIYGMPKKFLIFPIIIGHLLFLFTAGVIIDLTIDFVNQENFWLIIGLIFFTNLILSIIFYSIGNMRYKKKTRYKERLLI